MSQARVVEIRDSIRKNWIRERSEYLGEQRHGLREKLSIKGEVMERWHYVDGREHGPYAELWGNDVPRIVGEYRRGVRVGRWVFNRHDRSVAGLVDYDEHGRVATWRALAPDGRERVAMPILHDDDVLRWIDLEDAWDDLVARETSGRYHARDHTHAVQRVIDRWPADEYHRPLAWVSEREYSARWCPVGPWLEAILETDDDDPRFKLIEWLDLGHHTIEAHQLPRLLRLAPQIVKLSLVETIVEPSLCALFAPGVDWSRLEQLHLDECGNDEELACIAAARLPALRTLTVYATDGNTDLLVNAPWRPQLDTFQIGDDADDD